MGGLIWVAGGLAHFFFAKDYKLYLEGKGGKSPVAEETKEEPKEEAAGEKKEEAKEPEKTQEQKDKEHIDKRHEEANKDKSW